MREKLETLPMTELREIAKVNNIKSVTAMRKSALIDKILEVTSEKEAKEPIKEVTKSEFENETLAERTYTPSQSRTYAKPEERKNMGKNSPENRLNDIKNNDIKNNDIKNSDIKNTETRTTDTKISENRTVTDESLDSGIIANGIWKSCLMVMDLYVVTIICQGMQMSMYLHFRLNVSDLKLVILLLEKFVCAHKMKNLQHFSA